MTFPTTPSRRSKRFQPLVSPSKPSRRDSRPSRAQWKGGCILDRPTAIETDLFDEELERASTQEGRAGYDGARTYFYQAFNKSSQKPRSTKKGKVSVEDDPAETYKLGDTVFVTTLARQPSIGVISAMWQVERTDDEEPAAQDLNEAYKIRVHWYLRPMELPAIRAQREHSEAIYYSVSSSAVVRPSSILSHCIITTEPPAQNGKRSRWTLPSLHPRVKALYDTESESDSEPPIPTRDTFYCRLAVDSRRGIFYKFSWPDHLVAALSAILRGEADDESVWCLATEDLEPSDPKPNTKGKGKARASVKTKVKPEVDSDDGSSDGAEHSDKYQTESEKSDDTDEGSEALNEDDEDDFEQPATPSRKRKRGLSTPRKPRQKRLAQPTPHSKAALTKRRKLSKRRKSGVNLLPSAGLGNVLNDGKGATYALGVGKGDLKLIDDPWMRAMYLLHVGSRPDALPCREEEYDKVLRSVSELLEEGSGGCIYISGVPGTGKTATVHAVVRELKRQAEENETNPFTFVEINGLRLSEPAAAYSLLYEAVSGHDVEREGHLPISAKESLKLLTKHFSSGNARGPGGHACVVLMDELDQLMTTKQDVVYNFFNWPTLVGSKLVVLAVANTMDLPERVMTGRVRSRLGMIRINFAPYKNVQLIEIVRTRLANSQEGLENPVEVIKPDAIKFAAMKVSGISGDARRVLDICRRTVELVKDKKMAARVDDVKDVVRSMQNSPVAAYLRDCSLHERIMLASLVKCIRREGVDEIKWGEIQHQHIIYMNVLPGDSDPRRKPTPYELSLVLDSLTASHALLVEDGVAAARRAPDERKVILNLEQSEVERVLSELGGQVWKNVLS